MKKRKNKVLKNERFSKSFIDFVKNTKFMNNSVTVTKSDTKGKVIVEIPESFSLIKNPDEAIRVYTTIFKSGTSKMRSFFFDHSKCKELDIGASTVMDVLTINMEKYQKIKFGREINFVGRFSEDNSINELLHVSGILKFLDVNEEIRQKIIEKNKNLKTLELIRGGHHSTTMLVSKNLDSGTVGTKLINYFNECLLTQNHELSIKGRSYFSRLISEAIDNCKLHSGEFGQFFVHGHYDIKESESYGECSIVLFNFGDSIYEGFKKTKLSDEIKRGLKRLTNIHVGSFFRSDWNEEVLWTLYALQENVSRLRGTSEKDQTRGVGTINLINSFQKIGWTSEGVSPVMSIISGSTFILFNNEYSMTEKDINGESLKTIAFNSENNLELPPDPNNVRMLKNFFPGTIITMKFNLDRKYLEKIKNEVDLDNESKTTKNQLVPV